MKKLATIAADGRLKIQKISDRVRKVRPSMLPHRLVRDCRSSTICGEFIRSYCLVGSYEIRLVCLRRSLTAYGEFIRSYCPWARTGLGCAFVGLGPRMGSSSVVTALGLVRD
jgi:hypothetical protein